MQNKFYLKYGKRIFDFFSSLMGIFLFLPFYFIIGILIKIEDKGPILYKSRRIGQNFKPFYLLKFRSMIVNADKIGPLITKDKDPRITKIGKFLRKTKLDEFPQLFNVLKGEMSIVGPRPEVEKYISYFKKDYEKILSIKPGITDYAAIEFRNEEEILNKFKNTEESYIREILPKKINLYKKYLNEVGFITDLNIIFKTIWKVLRK